MARFKQDLSGSAMLLSALVALPASACAEASPPGTSNNAPVREPVSTLAMAPTFTEGFQGSSLDPTKWNSSLPAGSPITDRTMANNAEREVYFDDAYLDQGLHVFSVMNGVLTITANPMTPRVRSAVQAAVALLPPNPALAPLQQLGYTSGRITTRGKFSQRYGYFEMRARSSAGKGLWPAFWLLPEDGSWPPEIDVMEILGQQPLIVHSTVHSTTMPQQGSVVTLQPTSDGFHRYGVLWTPTTITYYIDGARAASAVNPPEARKPMYMIANLAVGGYWPGDPDATTPFPAKLEIDYIRAWQFRAGTMP